MVAMHQPRLEGRDPAADQDELNSRIQTYYDRHGDIYDLYQWYVYDWFAQAAWWRECIEIGKRVGRRPMRVLDLGCGTGHLGLKFLQMKHDVLGVDISRRMLELFRRKAETRPMGRLDLVTADTREFLDSTDATFDVVCESSMLHHIFEYEDLVRGMARKVAPGGVLYLTREPLGPQELERLGPIRDSIANQLERVYRRLFVRMSRAYMFSHMIAPPDLSRISANFYESGISLDRVSAIVESEGLRMVSLRRFNERETGLLSYLDHRIFRWFRKERFQKSFYSLIAERPA